MRFRIALEEEARAQLRNLAPDPKRHVRSTLREMALDPYALNAKPLELPVVRFRIRAGDYRIVFRPGPGEREVTVTRIGHRATVYEGLERSGDV